MSARVVVPDVVQPALVLVLTCGTCRRTFEPDPAQFASGRVCCPACQGWTFTASLAQGGDPR